MLMKIFTYGDIFLFVSTFLGRVRSISQERFKGLNLRERAERGFPLPCGKVVFVRTREGRWMLCSAQPERPASASGLKYMSSDFQFVTVASPTSNLSLRALLCWRSRSHPGDPASVSAGSNCNFNFCFCRSLP